VAPYQARPGLQRGARRCSRTMDYRASRKNGPRSAPRRAMTMTATDPQAALYERFPSEADIPEACRMLTPLNQRAILLDGELRIWKGETRPILSPVHVRQPDGSLAPVELGSVPVTGT